MDEVKQFLRFYTVDSFKPIKSEDYLAKYLHVHYSIQQIKPTNKYFYFEVFKLILSFPFFYFIFLYFMPSEGRDIILKADIAAYAHFDRNFNFIMCCYMCLIMFMFHMLYCSDDVQIVLLGINSLLENNPKQLFHWPYIYKNRNALEFVKNRIIKWLNSLYLFYLCECKVFSFGLNLHKTNYYLLVLVFLFFEFIYFNFMYEFKNDILEIGFLRLIWPQIMTISYCFTMNGLVHVGVILLTMFTMNYYVLRFNMWMLTNIVSIGHTNLRKFNIKLLWYQKVYIKTLISMLKYNKYFSKLFFAFLIINLPINCYLNFLLMSATNIMVIIVLIFVLTEQVMVIIVIHWTFASHNTQFDKNILNLTKQFYQNNFPVKFSFNLKMSLFIQAFHTKKKYGYTYGKFGIISMMAFTKVRSLVWLNLFKFNLLLSCSLFCFMESF